MKESNPRVLMCGLGYFEQRLLDAICGKWSLTVVDIDDHKIDELEPNYPQVEFLRADATSLLVWKRLPLEQLRHVILTLRDTDANVEICRMVRELFKLDIPLIVLMYEKGQDDLERFSQWQITPIYPLQVSIDIVINRLQRNHARAIDIGQRKGEIIELNVMSKSHLTDRRMRYLRPSRWHLAALYRDEKLILPGGDTIIRVGDRVVLSGEPRVLEAIANSFLRGIAQFPRQYGSNLGLLLDPGQPEVAEEAFAWHSSTRSEQIELIPLRQKPAPELLSSFEGSDDLAALSREPVSSALAVLDDMADIGCLVMPDPGTWLFWAMAGRELFTRMRRPVLVARQSAPYRDILICLNGRDPVYALEMGVELGQLMQLPMRAFVSVPPDELRTGQQSEDLEATRKLVADFESIHKKKIELQVLEGNPVREGLGYVGQFVHSVLVIGSDPRRAHRLLDPDPLFLLARRSPVTTLIVPMDEDLT